MARRKNDILASVHSTATGLNAAGLMDDPTLRRFDELCQPIATPADYGPEAVRNLRHRLGLSQSVFAEYLNVGRSTVAAWEKGTTRPGGGAQRLLDLMDRNGLGIFQAAAE